MAASSTDDLWLLCGSQASAGEQSKQLFRSSDGGATWSLVAAAVLGTPAQASGAPNPLPLAGYIAPFTIGHRNLAVASPETAWLFPSRAVCTARRTVERAGIRFPSSLPPGSPAAAKGTSRSSVRLTGGSAPTASGSGRRQTGPTGIPSARADACGPACPLGRRAHHLLCWRRSRSPRARGDRSASAASSGTPSCAAGQVRISESPGVPGMGHFSDLIQVTNTDGRACDLRGFPSVGLLNSVRCARRDGGAERCCPGRPDEPSCS